MKRKAAIRYAEKGFSVIPVGDKKKPLVKWAQYQKEKAPVTQIEEWWEKWPDANIGIVTGKISNLIVVDIDLYKREEALAEIQEHVPDNALFPIAKSPRGGQHWYFEYQEGLKNLADVLPDVDIRTDGGFITVPPSSNGKGNYAWLEDLKISNVGLSAMPSSLYKVLCFNCKKYAPSNKPLPSDSSHQASSVVKFTSGSRDDDLFHVANCLVKGGMHQDNILKTLQNLAFSCDPPFSQKEAREKIASALERAEKKDRILSVEVRDFVVSSAGVFFSSEMIQNLHLSSREEKKNLSKILSRLKTEGVIERHGNRNGCWRKIDKDCQPMDWINADDKEFELQMPLDLYEMCKVFPRNIILIAGSPNVGKTTFMLNIARMNMDKNKINYFNSEMSPQALRERLKKFGMPLAGWKIDFYPRSENFEDVIKPNDLNIIDYLEVTKDFYEVGDKIKRIFDKLESGIVVIAIQKNSGSDFGRGGQIGLEKPSLYVTLDNIKGKNIAKIVKCKSYRHGENPNLKTTEFKIVEGARILQPFGWERE